MHRQVELPASGGQGLDRTQRTVIHSNEAHRARRRPAERVTERRIDTQPLYRRAVFADGQPDMAALVDRDALVPAEPIRSEEHTSELQSLMRISSAVFCSKK